MRRSGVHPLPADRVVRDQPDDGEQCRDPADDGGGGHSRRRGSAVTVPHEPPRHRAERQQAADQRGRGLLGEIALADQHAAGRVQHDAQHLLDGIPGHCRLR